MPHGAETEGIPDICIQQEFGHIDGTFIHVNY